MSATVSDVITDALTELGQARAGDVPSAEDSALGLSRLNDLLDQWNTDGRAAYTTNFVEASPAGIAYALSPGTSPHTMGVAGSVAGSTDPNFIVANVRPVAIVACQINLAGTPNAFTPVKVRDDEWYANQPVPGVSMSVPTDLYYTPNWTDGNSDGLAYGALYFWGVPSVAYGVRFWIRQTFAQVALTDVFSQPPGYKKALTLSLAEDLAGAFDQEVGPSLARKAREARAAIFGTNLTIPLARPKDVNIGSHPRMSSFNWLSRQTRSS